MGASGLYSDGLGSLDLIGGNVQVAGTLQSTGAAVLVSAPQVSVSGLALSAAGLALIQASGPISLTNSTLAGADLMLAAGGALNTSRSTFKASGDARLTAGGEMTLVAGRVAAGGNIALSAVGDLTLAPASDSASSNEAGTSRTTTRFSRVALAAGNSISAQSSAGLLTLDGAQLSANSGSIALQGLGLVLNARKDLTSETTVAGNTTTKPSTETLVGVKLQAEGDIAVLASGTGADQGKLFAAGATIESGNGQVSLLAARDVNISHDITTDRFYERFYEINRSWFSKRVTDKLKTSVDETVQPSVISGRSVSIGAGGALNLVGSAIFSDGAVGLHADGDLKLLSTAESDLSYSSSSVSKSGIFGNGGLSITIGSKSSSSVTSSASRVQHGSSVASLAGDIAATAGGQYLQISSDLTAPQGDINIVGASVAIKNDSDTTSVLNLIRQRQSGLTLSASHPLIEVAQTVDQMAKLARRTDNARYQALGLLTAGLTVYNNFKAFDADKLQAAADPLSGSGWGGWSVNASLGSSSYSFDSLTKTSTPISSTMDAGRHLGVSATGSGTAGGSDSGDITLIAAKLSAGNDLRLSAARDITLAAAIGSSSETSQTRSSRAMGNESSLFGQIHCA